MCKGWRVKSDLRLPHTRRVHIATRAIAGSSEGFRGENERSAQGERKDPSLKQTKTGSSVYSFPMPNQIVLAWTVDTTNTPLGPAGAATALGAVPLYVDTTTDPVLGQLYGLTVASDVSAPSGPTQATRTLTLNIDSGHVPAAPPPFPCHPRTSTPPVLPYPLRATKTLPGSFFVQTGSMVVAVSQTQIPSLSIGDNIQFLSEEGVFYVVGAVGSTSIGITTPYTGVSANTSAFKEVVAPAKIAAVFSTSPLDTAGVATVPAIPVGPGAQSVTLTYKDSNGVSNTLVIPLTGRRPALIALPTAPAAGFDIAEIDSFTVSAAGTFGSSVGQITLVSLESALPAIPSNATPTDFKGPLTDEAQMLIDRALVYLPPSYFSLAGQQASTPQLAGDFIVTTGSTSVPTTVDQTGALAPGDIIQFASQLDVFYTIATVAPGLVKLTTPYTGIDDNFTGTNNEGTNSNRGTMGNLGDKVTKTTGAFLVNPSPAAPPSNTELAEPLGQFVALETAGPPPNPPLDPATVPVPTFLSGLFTRTLQVALAGVPVVPQTITFV